MATFVVLKFEDDIELTEEEAHDFEEYIEGRVLGSEVVAVSPGLGNLRDFSDNLKEAFEP